jgi:hypothetical protein
MGATLHLEGADVDPAADDPPEACAALVGDEAGGRSVFARVDRILAPHISCLAKVRSPVRSRLSAAAVTALGAAVLTSLAGAASLPYLRSASSQRRHVVAVFTLGELAPSRIAVAVSSVTGANGAFVPANVRIKEVVHATRVTNGYRVRTQHTLRPGKYYVQVSGLVVGLDCTPLKPCREDWSNVRRVVIPRLH